jgi:hypothetical protein
MKVLSLYKPAPNVTPRPGIEAAMGRFIDELTKSGVLLATEGRKAGGKDLRVRLSGGELNVTDGPFTESKELIAGFAVLKVKSREHLLDVTRRFLEICGDGECEISEVYDPADGHP